MGTINWVKTEVLQAIMAAPVPCSKQETACLLAVASSAEVGMTCEQAAHTLAIGIQSASPCFRKLSKAGLIIKTGTRRRTTSGRTAAVYVVVGEVFDAGSN